MGDVGGFAEDLTGLNVSGNSSSDQALAAQQNAAKSASAAELAMYNQTREDLAPWREAGGKALGQMQDGDYMRDFSMSDFVADPGYKFRMEEGQKALERSASARGGLMGGGFAKALTRYGQDQGTQEYGAAYNRFNADRDRRFNRLSSLAGVGQTAQAQTTQAGQAYTAASNANMMGAANAQAGQAIAQANQTSSLVGQGMTAAAMFSDERLKTNIEPISKGDLSEMRKHLKAFHFNYISDEFGTGEWMGVMAQDLEKSKLGRTMVVEDENGLKKVDMNKVMSVFLATQAEG